MSVMTIQPDLKQLNSKPILNKNTLQTNARNNQKRTQPSPPTNTTLSPPLPKNYKKYEKSKEVLHGQAS